MVRAPVATSSYSGERLGQVATGAWLVTHLRFAAGDRVRPHAHGNPIVTCVLNGQLAERVARRSFSLTDRECYIRPGSEPHANVIGRDGAAMVVVEANREANRLDPAVDRLLDEITVRPAGPTTGIARRLARELRIRDAATPLAIDGLVLTLLGALLRRGGSTPLAPTAALIRAREYLDANFRSPMRLARLAAVVDLEPGFLARAFRRTFGRSPAGYQRDRQIAWVTAQLRDPDRTISRIAAEAGFADHSHLTRSYRAATGRTPSSIRADA